MRLRSEERGEKGINECQPKAKAIAMWEENECPRHLTDPRDKYYMHCQQPVYKILYRRCCSSSAAIDFFRSTSRKVSHLANSSLSLATRSIDMGCAEPIHRNGAVSDRP